MNQIIRQDKHNSATHHHDFLQITNLTYPTSSSSYNCKSKSLTAAPEWKYFYNQGISISKQFLMVVLSNLLFFDTLGKNALHLASRNGHSLCVQKLLQVWWILCYFKVIICMMGCQMFFVSPFLSLLMYTPCTLNRVQMHDPIQSNTTVLKRKSTQKCISKNNILRKYVLCIPTSPSIYPSIHHPSMINT